MNQELLETLCVLAKEKEPEIRKHRICAAIIHKHREIISVGYPRRKTHPFQKLWGTTEHKEYLHAEVDALLKAKRLGYEVTKDTSLYIARVKHPHPFTNKFIGGLAQPCSGCSALIEHLGITSVVYTTG